MEPAHGRRLSRLALSLWVAPPALVAVWAWDYALFVGVTAMALAAVALVVRPRV